MWGLCIFHNCIYYSALTPLDWPLLQRRGIFFHFGLIWASGGWSHPWPLPWGMLQFLPRPGTLCTWDFSITPWEHAPTSLDGSPAGTTPSTLPGEDVLNRASQAVAPRKDELNSSLLAVQSLLQITAQHPSHLVVNIPSLRSKQYYQPKAEREEKYSCKVESEVIHHKPS